MKNVFAYNKNVYLSVLFPSEKNRLVFNIVSYPLLYSKIPLSNKIIENNSILRQQYKMVIFKSRREKNTFKYYASNTMLKISNL